MIGSPHKKETVQTRGIQKMCQFVMFHLFIREPCAIPGSLLRRAKAAARAAWCGFCYSCNISQDEADKNVSSSCLTPAPPQT
jgi:hypothetical protein